VCACVRVCVLLLFRICSNVYKVLKLAQHTDNIIFKREQRKRWSYDWPFNTYFLLNHEVSEMIFLFRTAYFYCDWRRQSFNWNWSVVGRGTVQMVSRQLHNLHPGRSPFGIHDGQNGKNDKFFSEYIRSVPSCQPSLTKTPHSSTIRIMDGQWDH